MKNNTKWIVQPKPNPTARLRLICLPFAGGGSASFRDWVKYLPGSIELCTIEIPGRGQRLSEPLMKNSGTLIEAIGTAIYSLLDRPFAIFGHSMGALLGFELSHYLQKKYGLLPEHLLLSGRGAAHLPSKDEPIHVLSETDFIQKIKAYNGTPKEILEHQELMDIMVPILRADFQVCETYSYEEKSLLDCPITAYGGLSDSSVNKSELDSWSKHTSRNFNSRMFPGDHFYLQNNTATLLHTIIRDINQNFNLN